MSASRPLVVERRVRAPAHVVFAYFATSERWVMWQGVDAEIDLRPGGVFRVNVTGAGYASGRVVEVVPDRRIVFTWGWEHDSPVRPGSSTVEIDLLPEQDGTLIRLTHSGLPPEAHDVHRHGWQNYVGRLVSVSEGTDPGPDPLRVPER